MPRVAIPIANGFYRSRSLPISAQECVNWYPNITQAPGLSQETLFGIPGIHELANTGVVKQVNRGFHVKNKIAYIVNGTTLYRVNENFSFDVLGAIPGDGRVSMTDNGVQLVILVPGGDGFVFNENDGTPFKTITDAGFKANGNPQQIIYINGFFIATTDSKKFIFSSPNDALNWNALDVLSAEADPDDIVSAISFSNQLFIGGSETIEVFQGAASANTPFQRVEGFVIPVGVIAPFSMIATGKSFYFIGGGVNESPSIWAFNGSGVDPISTDAIDSILQEFTNEEIQGAFSWSYSQSGSRFVGFSLPTTTLVYDTVSQRWHERRSQIIDPMGVRNLRWRVNSMVTAYNKVLVGDSQDGRIGEVDLSFFDEYSGDIIRRVAVMPISDRGNPLFLPEIELTVESGVGDFETIDPQIRMAISLDGKTFTDERSRSMGEIGEYDRRLIWRRNGRVPRFGVLQFTMSAQVKPVIAKLEIDIRQAA